MKRVRIVFPEMENEVVRAAIERVEGVEAVSAGGLEEGCAMVASGVGEGMVAGIDYTSREVILACRDIIGVTGATFSASFVMRRKRGRYGGEDVVLREGMEGREWDEGECYVIGDAAACKNPTEAQLYDITMQTYATAKAVLQGEPMVAMLSFSTFGSGGTDPSMERARAVIKRIRTAHPEVMIDGEMQLDAAVNREIGRKKAGGSSVAGRANVLILPDLNSGNILYKAMEQFGGFTAAGPILQGFKAPCSDLSRGSTVADVAAVIEVIKQQILLKNGEERS